MEEKEGGWNVGASNYCDSIEQFQSGVLYTCVEKKVSALTQAYEEHLNAYKFHTHELGTMNKTHSQ